MKPNTPTTNSNENLSNVAPFSVIFIALARQRIGEMKKFDDIIYLMAMNVTAKCWCNVSNSIMYDTNVGVVFFSCVHGIQTHMYVHDADNNWLSTKWELLVVASWKSAVLLMGNGCKYSHVLLMLMMMLISQNLHLYSFTDLMVFYQWIHDRRSITYVPFWPHVIHLDCVR